MIRATDKAAYQGAAGSGFQSLLRPHHPLGPGGQQVTEVGGAGDGAQEGRRVPGLLLHRVF